MLCLIGIALIGKAQHYQVVDSESGTSIPFVNVYYPQLHTGTTADSTGQFNVVHQQKDLVVQFSAIGYKTEVLNTNELPADGKIKLEGAHMEVQEVLVSAPAAKLSGESAMNIIGVGLVKDHSDASTSLTDQLSTVPGITNTSTGIGIGKPTIRGLSGNRVAVFSQGVRVENQQWGGEHGLGLDANGYQHVEVIKGPASLLYGSDALGGVLYFVDGRFADHNSLEAGVQTQFNSNTVGLRNSAYFKLSKNRFHWNIFGAHSNHKDYHDGAGNRVDNSRFHTTDLKTTLGYTSAKWSAALRYNYLNENYGLTEENIGESHTAGSRTLKEPYQVLNTHIASMENTFFIDKGSSLMVNVGFVSNQRQEFEHSESDSAHVHEEGHASLDMTLSTASYNAKWKKNFSGTKWNLIMGSQGMYQLNRNHGEEVLIPDANTADIGVFGIVNLAYSRRSFWQFGVRYDARFLSSKRMNELGDEGYFEALDRTFHAFNFSTGINQRLAKDLSLRLTAASGFRPPNTFELLSDGAHHGSFRYEVGNRDLKSENAYQFDLSLDYSGEHFEVFANPFVNYIRHFIYIQSADSTIGDLPVYDYVQNDAVLYGGEAGLHIHPHPIDWLHLRWNYSNVYGQLTSGPNLPLIPAQQLTTIVRADLTFDIFVKTLGIYVRHDYTFAQNNLAQNEIKTSDYHLLGAGVELGFNIKDQPVYLDLSASNLLNTRYFSHLSRYKTEGILNMGRNFVVTLKIPLKRPLKETS